MSVPNETTPLLLTKYSAKQTCKKWSSLIWNRHSMLHPLNCWPPTKALAIHLILENVYGSIIIYFLSTCCNMLNTSGNSLANLSFDRCRICLLSECEMEEELLNVCACRGSAGSVHLHCLEIWLRMTNRATCEICSQPYQIIRQPIYGILSSIPAFVNETVLYKRTSFGYFVLCVLFFALFVPYIIEHEYASWDYTLFLITLLTLFLTSTVVMVVKEWTLWRQEQYKLTPAFSKRKI